jgi:putative ABC transport system permease protein
LSHQFWRRQFGGDSSIVGQALTLNGTPHTVVGVVSPAIEFGNLSEIDIWVPLTIDRSVPRDRRIYRISGRLAPGVTVEQADAEVREVSRRLEREHPGTNRGWAARVAPTTEAIAAADTWVILALLMTVVGFVLLIACANIANLVLARATGRRRELAVRTALGASRGRVIRQLLTEAVLFGVLGGALGLAFAQLGLVAIKAAAHEPFFALIDIDRNVLFFTGALALLAPLLFSVLPALHASRADVNDMLKESTVRSGGGVSGRRSRSVLVVSQLSLAMALLIVSALLVRNMIELARSPLGFEPGGLLTLQLEVPEWRYRTDASIVDYYDRLIARLQGLPGVRAVAAADRLPVLGGESVSTIEVDGYAPGQPDDRPWAVTSFGTEDFFTAAGIPIVAGRAFTQHDDGRALQVAVVNEDFARRYWGDPQRRLGRRVTLAGAGVERRTFHVVGVSGNVKQPDLTGVNPHLYLHARQSPNRAMAVMVRADDAEALLGPVRAEVRAVDIDVAVFRLRTVEEALAAELSSTRILIGMFVSFAVLALLLAAAGLYGVISYSVSQRVQEIGIRMALGAVPADIRRMVARETVVLVAVGSILGLAGGAAIARAASSVLFAVSATDPATYAGVALALISIALLASYAPVRRATRIDPLVALRSE